MQVNSGCKLVARLRNGRYQTPVWQTVWWFPQETASQVIKNPWGQCCGPVVYATACNTDIPVDESSLCFNYFTSSPAPRGSTGRWPKSLCTCTHVVDQDRVCSLFLSLLSTVPGRAFCFFTLNPTFQKSLLKEIDKTFQEISFASFLKMRQSQITNRWHRSTQKV